MRAHAAGASERRPLCRHSLNITPPETVKILQKYAMRTNREAQFLLGSAYQHGEYGYGLVRCSKKAAKHFALAAAQGQTGALCNLAIMLEQGDGAKLSASKAVAHYHAAADAGLAQAQCNLGCCLERGSGVAADMREALRYYWLACAQGFAEAELALGFMYKQGLGPPAGLPLDLDEAFRLFALAAAHPEPSARASFNLGLCYELRDRRRLQTTRPPRDRAALPARVRALAPQFAFPAGENALAGRGVPHNRNEGIRRFTVAAGLGSEKAQGALAIFYIRLHMVGD